MATPREFRPKKTQLPETWEILEKIQAYENLDDRSMAALLDLPLSRFEKLKTARTSPSAYSVAHLCIQLNCSFEALITGQIFKDPHQK
jgi:hypothetical protein